MAQKTTLVRFIAMYSVFIALSLVLVPILMTVQGVEVRESYFTHPHMAFKQDVAATLFAFNVAQGSIAQHVDSLSMLDTQSAESAMHLFAPYIDSVNTCVFLAVFIAALCVTSVNSYIAYRKKHPRVKHIRWEW